MKTVFVVLGELGEYSQQSTWVSGIFTTREAAQEAMTSAMARRRIFEAWSDSAQRHRKTIDSRGPFGWRFPRRPEDDAEWDAMIAEAERRAGPKPTYERSERVQLFEVPVDEWQNEHIEELLNLRSERR